MHRHTYNHRPIELRFKGETFTMWSATLFVNTNFDETKISAIVKGRTTRAEVIRLLGTPSASYIPPMVPETAVEAIGYTYTVTRDRLFRGPASSTKLLRLTFDDKGQVVEIDYTSSGNR